MVPFRRLTRFRAGPVALLGVAALGLVGCSSAQLTAHGAKSAARTGAPSVHAPAAADARGSFKIGNPYQVDGIWYYPRVEANYSEVGIASWYGPKFHGKRTANGAIYDMHGMTAAHKTLPMPTQVRVTNLKNGRSILVEVNDRGPFVNGRIIDLSYGAAQALDFHRSGLATVRVEALSPENRLFVSAKPATPPVEQQLAAAAPTVAVDVDRINAPRGYVETPRRIALAPPSVAPAAGRSLALFIQAGAFTVPVNATRLGHQMAARGPIRIIAETVDGGPAIYRVQLGPYGDVEAADAALRHLIRDGYTDAILVVD